MDALELTGLLRKYDVPVPRYTSYPTVPFWNNDAFTTRGWIDAVRRSFNESNSEKGISIYIHLPFCESLCTYCACNTRITRNHKVESVYLEALEREWQMYKDIFGSQPVIRQIHLGGGTPTFFSAPNLERLTKMLLTGSRIHQDCEFSFEGHPNNTTYEHLKVLYDLGFTRVSYGVQDLNENVQKAINRIQPFSQLKWVTEQSRSIGYTSVSFDLVYGLPLQTSLTVSETMSNVLELKPDRLSFYSYAHVPWIKPGQRGYEDKDLPTDVEKRQLYETGRMLLKANGYEDIGMDHFALPHDSLFKASENGTLHRNFMGYTTAPTKLLIGLGASAISDATYAYAQNKKTVEEYQTDVSNGKLAVFKGHLLSERDIHNRKRILGIACEGNISLSRAESSDTEIMETLCEMQGEGILSPTPGGFKVTPTGAAFVRNICAVFDEHLKSSKKQVKQVFSQAI